MCPALCQRTGRQSSPIYSRRAGARSNPRTNGDNLNSVVTLPVLATAYAMYFGALGVTAPYLNLYLQDLGFSLAMIGTITALMVAVRIVGQLGWSWLADQTGQSVLIIRSASVATVMLIASGWYLGASWILVPAMLLWSVTLSACLPQIESITLSRLGPDKSRYGRVRLWGSLGFMLSVVATGYALDITDTSIIMVLMMLLYSGLALSLFAVPRSALSQGEVSSSITEPLLKSVRRVWLLLFVCFLMQASHAPFYTFFSIHLDSLGYSGAQTGALWAIGVVCEVLVFYVAARLLHVMGAQWLLVLTFAAATVRWILLATLAQYPVWVSISQCLHGLTFGACHAASIHLVHDRFHASSRYRGQAIYASVTYGGGIALGTWLSGWAWQQHGPRFTLLGAATTAAVATLLGAWWAWRGLPVGKANQAGHTGTTQATDGK